MKVILSSSVTIALIISGIFGATASSTSTDGTPVQVQIKCSGLNMKNLSEASKTILSQVLEESYKDTETTKSNGSFLTINEDVSWRCGRLCPDNDDAILSKLGSDGELYMDGYWRCGRLCPDNDDVTFNFIGGGGIRGGGGSNIATWEKKFIQNLIGTSRSDFQSVKQCNIVMTSAINEKST